MPTTSNFGWTTPADTDLVKDGAAAIRTLGNGIDTSLVDLKGGTTGQILSKNSNTDLDYTWVTPNVGDITEVQAGTGISIASGTGPIPVVTNDMATTITASGDIVVGTGSGTYDNLPIGTTGQVLTADTTVSPYKVKWATAAGGGKVLQVVSATYSTPTTIASTSMTDTGLSASITPSANTSKILVMVTHPSVYSSRSNLNDGGIGVELRRNTTTVYSLDNSGYNTFYRSTQTLSDPKAQEGFYTISFSYLDSPATTSSITYKTRGRKSDTSNSSTSTYQSESVSSSIILLEIGA